MDLETFTIAVPITRQVTLQAPTAEAALLLAAENALESGLVSDSLELGQPWIVTHD